MSPENLVIVESPAKARTLAGILGRDYVVKASVGHVRDLPKGELGVDVAHGFQPRYVVPREKQRVVQELREAAREASTIYLATDPDREGEAIAWHLVQAVDLAGKVCRRAVFHEVTPQAIREAFRHPREIDMQLVDAQQARRILDRLLGYKLSPLLWQKVRRGLSAGRVQSVAVRLVVEREREVEGFVPQEYWTIETELARSDGQGPSFRAKLVGLVGRRRKLEIASQEQAQSLVAALSPADYRVADLQRKEQVRRPAPPFTTSALQQEASRRFRFSPKRTMALAQQLYEGLSLGDEGEVGLITYMRTDSTQVAEAAVQEARAYIREKFGQEFLPPSPQVYRRKAKRAQEAHEAIRPTAIRREPAAIRRYLTPDQHRLYSLIWQRMVASQMANALYDVTTVDVEARPQAGEAYLLRAVDSRVRFLGYRQLYAEASDDEAQEQQGGNPLPDLAVGDALRFLGLTPEQHFTEPPPRYSEASLVKALEEKGIGRPSTYASILSTIQERGYVAKEEGRLRPSELGRLVNDLLTTYFSDVVDVGFTAQMEDELDDIARGQRPWQPVVQEFYDPLARALAVAQGAPKVVEATDQICEKCSRPMVIRWGRRGRFLACSGFPECRNSRDLEGAEEPAAVLSEEPCPQCDAPMVARRGRYGPFLACTRYPQCQGSRPLLEKVGVACPQCGGHIVARRSRRGRTFYGCANYPACGFTAWSRPLRQPCPPCGGLLLAAGQGQGRCRGCGWQGQVAEEELAATPS